MCTTCAAGSITTNFRKALTQQWPSQRRFSHRQSTGFSIWIRWSQGLNFSSPIFLSLLIFICIYTFFLVPLHVCFCWILELFQSVLWLCYLFWHKAQVLMSDEREFSFLFNRKQTLGMVVRHWYFPSSIHKGLAFIY